MTLYNNVSHVSSWIHTATRSDLSSQLLWQHEIKPLCTRWGQHGCMLSHTIGKGGWYNYGEICGIMCKETSMREGCLSEKPAIGIVT